MDKYADLVAQKNKGLVMKTVMPSMNVIHIGPTTLFANIRSLRFH